MGYTHCWKSHNLDEMKFRQAIQAMRKVVKQEAGILNRVRHSKPDALLFNGLGEDAHEDFFLYRNREFNFCKTAQKPYDVVVVACLCILSHYCPESNVSSDGCPHEWLEGLQLARQATGLKSITLPKLVLNLDGYVKEYQQSYKQNHTLEKALIEYQIAL